MSSEPMDSRTLQAIDEIEGLIRASYPNATFDVGHGEDPDGTYLRATVDVDEMDQVVDVFIDRLVELQVDEVLPLYVIPLEPVGRALARMQAYNERAVSQATVLSHTA